MRVKFLMRDGKQNMRYFFTIICCLVLNVFSFAQDEQPKEEQQVEKGFRKDKVFVGGNFGAAFGSYTLINLAPQAGYRFNKTLAAGVGMNLLYIGQKQYYRGELDNKTRQGIVGLNLFGRVYPISNFMIQVQPEANYIFGSQTYYATSYNPSQYKSNLNSEIVPSVLAGGGLVMPSDAGEFIISVMYDVLQNRNSPYGTRPVLNVGYNFNLRR